MPCSVAILMSISGFGYEMAETPLMSLNRGCKYTCAIAVAWLECFPKRIFQNQDLNKTNVTGISIDFVIIINISDAHSFLIWYSIILYLFCFSIQTTCPFCLNINYSYTTSGKWWYILLRVKNLKCNTSHVNLKPVKTLADWGAGKTYIRI
jgi:hypothetical protein